MFKTDEGKRKLAKSITHFVYRNTKIEDYHTEGVVMDDVLYSKVYKMVYRRINIVKKYYKYFATAKNLEALKEVPSKFNLENPLEFYNFAQEICFGFMFGSNWDDAEILPDKPTKGLASYILSGCFKQCCQEGRELDNWAMRYINKDVHNRIFTLIENGYFD